MKKLLLKLNFLIILFLSSCNSHEEIICNSTSEEGDFITLSLSMAGIPDSRATSKNDVYGINVYVDADKDGICEKRYAYGLFDNKDDMTITVLNSYTYDFECTLIKDAKNVLYCGSGDLMAYPFQTNNSTTTYVNNQFTYGTDYLSGISSGRSHLKGVNPETYNYTDIPATDRYYGQTKQYKPTTNGRVTIEMKRVVFGVQFFITGVQDGSVSINSNNLKDLGDNTSYSNPSIFSKTSTIDFSTEEMVFSYPNVGTCYSVEQDLEYTISMNYTSDRGSNWNYSNSQTITLKRNVLTKIYINVEPDLSSAKFILSEEAMDEDNVINIGLNTNGLLDIVVDPQEE